MQNNIFSGLFVGQNLITIKQIDSTNNFLKESLSNSKPFSEGTVIMAESQYAGRGQQQNRWHSEDGKNLTFSILLKPVFLPLAQQFDLTRAVSLGIINAITPLLGNQLKIKWPNDIYYADDKLGGILIENMVQGGQIKNSVIGIGLNINQEVFPLDVPNPVSLRQILRRDYDLKILLSDICKNIEVAYLNLKAGKFDLVRKAYLERLYWLNERKMFKARDLIFEGIIENVRDDGFLILNNGSGASEYTQKEIEFLNKNNG
ncbi:MAG TPA: biotin--[acetyl-CoA-carboxylase] ligase [Mucilaginibacter sp.]|nr:biotin--[acetyl-CoA-carboxylase] ligase [Mucilaginibacter sp.]